MTIARLDTSAADFTRRLDALTAWSDERDQEVATRVRDIIARVRREGDAALVALTRQFDGGQADTMEIGRAHV